MVMTTASQICRGVTGSADSIAPGSPPTGGSVSGIIGRITAAIARNLQTVTISPVSSRSVSGRTRPLEWRTKRIEMAMSTRNQCGWWIDTGPIA